MSTKNKLSITSLVFSTASIIALFFINRELADRYLSAHGKTRALFGLVEILSFSHKYYILIPAIISLGMAVYAIRKKETSWVAFSAMAMGIFSITAVFISFWKLFI